MENNTHPNDFPNPRKDFENNENVELQKKNKILTYALIGLGALLLIGGILFFTTRKKETETTVAQKDSVKTAVPANVFGDSVKVDSAVAAVKDDTPDPHYDEYGEEYEPYSENYVIANEAFVRTSPSESASKLSTNLKFGDRLIVDNSYNSGKYAKVYFTQPTKSAPQTAYYVTDYVLTYQGEFDEFKKYFSLKPFAGLAVKTKKLILDNDYSNSRSYQLTQNLERSKSALAYGDYDNDGIQDVAVVLDNNEDQYSRLLIICTNAATKDPYLAYAENFSDKMRINSYKKGAKIFMNSSSLVPSPADGVILNAEDAKIAIVYDKPNQKFNTFYQSSSDESDY